MAGLGAAASVVGIAAAALQSVQFLHLTVTSIKDVPDAICGIKNDLQSIEPVLSNLSTTCETDDTEIVLRPEIKAAVSNCEQSCKDFTVTLEHWMRHSTAERSFWVDRWRVALFGQERIAAFKSQLNGYKSTLNVALSTATIITTTRQHGIMVEMRDMMLKQQEIILQGEATRAQEQSAAIEGALQRVSTATNSPSDEELARSRQDLVNDMRRAQVSYEASRSMCEEMFSKTVEERTGQRIKVVKATEDGIALAGFINTTGEESKIRQDISDVSADTRGFAGAGVIKNLNFKDFRQARQ